MALPMAHTFSRNITAEAVLSGKYSNIRLKQITTNMNPAFPWISLHDAVATRLVAEHGKVNSTYLSTFSATCYYFGQSLTEELVSAAAFFASSWEASKTWLHRAPTRLRSAWSTQPLGAV